MSNLQFAAPIQSFEDAERFLADRDRRKLAHNTYVERVSDATIAVVYHWTPIVTYNANGSVTLNSGGFHTVTTSHRMHRLTPDNVRVFIKDRVMRVYAHTLNGPVMCSVDRDTTLVL